MKKKHKENTKKYEQSQKTITQIFILFYLFFKI
jgi:hypothetical protein